MRQISCEPLRIKESTNDYRLVCLYESIFTTIIDYYDGFQMTSISSEIYAVQINSDFDNYERGSEGSKEKTIDSGYRYLGFRIYKINDNYARCLTGNSLSEIYLENGEIIRVPSIKAKVVDTTGAGDTLNGAFSVRMAAGDRIEDALRYANVAAGLSVEKFGAQGGMPTDSEVRERMAE